MKPCPEFMDKLILEVYGEIDTHGRDSLEHHLASCPTCRKERQRLTSIVQLLHRELEAPAMSQEDHKLLERSILKKLRDQRTIPWYKRWYRGFPSAPLPAMAAGLLLTIGLVWFFLQGPVGSLSRRTAKLEREEWRIAQKYEILENMDLLREIETIQKLVRVVDQRDPVFRRSQ